jgi:hypothetical protein
LLFSEQDGHLDQLSHSINRQRDISLQINDELDVHTGLLEELDTELDHTEGRLSGARRRLERVARGTKENSTSFSWWEFYMIADDITWYRFDGHDRCSNPPAVDPHYSIQDVMRTRILRSCLFPFQVVLPLYTHLTGHPTSVNS